VRWIVATFGYEKRGDTDDNTVTAPIFQLGQSEDKEVVTAARTEFRREAHVILGAE